MQHKTFDFERSGLDGQVSRYANATSVDSFTGRIDPNLGGCRFKTINRMRYVLARQIHEKLMMGYRRGRRECTSFQPGSHSAAETSTISNARRIKECTTCQFRKRVAS